MHTVMRKTVLKFIIPFVLSVVPNLEQRHSACGETYKSVSGIRDRNTLTEIVLSIPVGTLYKKRIETAQHINRTVY